jgi:hypothetical protein
MKSLLLAAALGLGSLAVLAVPSQDEGLEVGSVAPNVTATTWFNHLGTQIDLNAFKDQAVVLEFWATW